MSRPGQRESDRQARIGLRIHADYYHKHPDACEPPVADAFRNASPGGCADAAAARSAHLMAQKGREKKKAAHHTTASTGTSTGWVMTEVFGPHNDFGHLIYGVQLPISESEEQLEGEEKNALQITREALLGASNLLTGKELDDNQGSSLWFFYQQAGIELGMGNIVGPLTRRQFEQMGRNQTSERRRKLREELHPILEVIAWYIREGIKEGIDLVTLLHGSKLTDLYLNDFQFIQRGLGGDFSDNDLYDAAKRVNAAWASLLKVGNWEEANRVYTLSARRGILDASSFIEVASEGEGYNLLGTRNSDIDIHAIPPRLATSPFFRRFGNSLAKGIAAVYERSLSDMILQSDYTDLLVIEKGRKMPEFENYEVLAHPFIPGVHYLRLKNARIFPQDFDTPSVFVTDEGRKWVAQNEDFFRLVLDGQAIGETQGDIYLTRMAGTDYLRSLAVRLDLSDGINLEEKNKGILKLIYPALRRDKRGQLHFQYLPGHKQLELLEVARKSLNPSGYNVVEALLATDEVLVTKEAAGNMSLYDFYDYIFHNKIPELVPLRSAIIDSVIDVTEDVNVKLKDAYTRHFRRLGMECTYDGNENALDIFDARPEQRKNEIKKMKLYLDISRRKDIERTQEALHGYMNWRFDEGKFMKLLEEKNAQRANGLLYEDVRDCLKESVTLFDLVEMESEGSERDIEQMARRVDINKFPPWRTFVYEVDSEEPNDNALQI
ncbi:MAG: hypothetical protein M1366_02645 [Patescibacteria group bacterium]|nr:hypothetical protein [Patescibacteria group bacterium]